MSKVQGVSEFKVKDLDDWDITTNINGRWVSARPIGLIGFKYRVQAAWKVLTGKADIVTWPMNQ
ncbi:MAG: hypothetical protein JXR12_06375 [Neptunomonas phycophila]|uniref:hypothetical protein n=1 Tax=Neptunomonas phycophila TaxID=1572645 RepID=UPI003B8E8805